MKHFFLIVFISFLLCPAALARQTYFYQTTNIKTGELADQSRLTIEKRDKDSVRLYFEKGFPGYPQKEEYILNKDYETLSWQVKNPQTQTDYKGIKIEDRVLIEGTLNGAAVSREYKLGGTPLFAFPKFEMIPFVLSDKSDTLIFWALRNDTLEIYKMTARKKGKEKIAINGGHVDARKVTWSTQNPLFRLFKRTYYFRPSDGIFIKQEYPDGRVRELIAEE